jgi:hypothetical protein
MLHSTLRRSSRAALTFCALGSLASSHALACGGTGGGVQGPAPTPPCVASTVIYKQVQQSLPPITALTFPIWVSTYITTSNCTPAVRLEVTIGVRNAQGALVGIGSIDIMNPQVNVIESRIVNVLRLLQPGIPPGIYTVQGVSTVTLQNGQRFTNSGDTCLAVVEASPSDPTLPRLNVELINFPNTGAHAGDHIMGNYRITNHDPVHSYTGDFIVRNKNSATLPTIEFFGPGSEPFFVYSIAAPGLGDNFPVAFANDLPPGMCLPLPPNPGDPAIPEAVSTITLAPGETIDVQVVSRGWGMCSGGSGCEQIALLTGAFSDGTVAEACAGGAAIIDDSIPSTYACDDGDSGAASMFALPSPGQTTLTWQARPSPTNQFEVITGAPSQIPANADGDPLVSQLRVVPVSDGWARYEWTLFKEDGTPLRANAVVEATLPVNVAAQSDDLSVVIANAQLMFFPGEPAGFENLFPFGKGMLAIDKLPTPLAVDSFFDIFFQIEAAAFGIECPDKSALRGPGSSGDPIPTEEFSLNFSPVPDGARFIANVRLRVPECPGGAQALTVAVNLKRGFARAAASDVDCPGDANGDNVVNFSDLNAVLATFGQSGPGLAGDVNGDGLVNFQDLNEVLSNFGAECA